MAIPGVGCGAAAAGAGAAAGVGAAAGAEAAATTDADGVAGAARAGGGTASPEDIEIRPLPTVSFVITGVFDTLRFVRFASATSGESAAVETRAVATSKPAMMVRMIQS